MRFGTKRIIVQLSSAKKVSTRYIPHALYSIAITSISIHLVNQRKTSQEDVTRINTQISLLKSIAEQLRLDKPLSKDELQRLKKLAQPVPQSESLQTRPERVIGWGEVFFGRKNVDEGAGMSKWDAQDLESSTCFFT